LAGIEDLALEIWIVLALAVAAVILLAVARLRRKRHTAQPAERNVYPLW
jgi:beta-lactamase regulating signal transducer with metallopeptidase domain